MRLPVLLLLFCCALTTNALANSTIAVFGDSLSAGFGLANGEGWVDLLQEKLRHTNEKYKVVNASISGDTTSGGRDRIEQTLKRHQPEIIIVELGGNDGLRGLSLGEMERNLDHIVGKSIAAGSKVLLVGMQIPPNYGLAYVSRFAKIYRDVAARHNVPLVPFFLEGIESNREYFQNDQIHPNAKAQPLLLNNVWPALEKLL